MYHSLVEVWQYWMNPMAFWGHFIPGVVLPMMIAIVGIVRASRRDLPFFVACIALSVILNGPYIWWQMKDWDMSLQLIDTGLIVLGCAYVFKQPLPGILVAFSGSWASIFLMDIAGAYVGVAMTPRAHMPLTIFDPLTMIGGEGWLDGLLVGPLFTAALVPVLRWLRTLDPRSVL